ncbi:flagellar basal body P-ring protein FlgI, partial [Sphingomonas sp. DC1200-1]|uniref:flagellar basal body P-ring protein FlgI n=1 Tax=Sphingomonas sp. DC1200-1 TaxID=2804660 RepID=UPI003CF77AD7
PRLLEDIACAAVLGRDVHTVPEQCVTETPQVSQPGPLSSGQTTVVPRTQVSVNDGNDAHLALIGGGASLKTLVSGLNALGVSPRDLITILQAVKSAGALQADIEVQ